MSAATLLCRMDIISLHLLIQTNSCIISFVIAMAIMYRLLLVLTIVVLLSELTDV